jgi:hypothetical protein
MSPHIQDFIDVPTPIRRKVRDFTGKTTSTVQVGTIRWNIEDDQGAVHEFLIPGSIYVPEGSSRLLSPQHWAYVAKDHIPDKYGTWCATFPDKIILYWHQRQYQRTIPLDIKDTNVATIYTAPGYTRFDAFCTDIGHEDGYETEYACDTNVVSDDEAEESSESQDDQSDDDSRIPRSIPLVTDFNINGPKESSEDSELPPTIIEDEEDTVPQDASAELLRWHHRLGHISFKKLQMMAKTQILPKKLSTCKVPLCTSCLFGKATRRPWRSKTSKEKQI